MLDYLAIGHIAQDLSPTGIRLGGTVAYSALTAQALGQRTGIVTAAAPGAVTTGLESLSLHILPSATSTVYENIYTPTGRIQKLHARAQPLTLDAVPESWRTASILHLAPIANEVDPALASQFPNAFIGLTPQGWMRRWNADTVIYRGDWEGSDSLLRRASAVVISIEDVAGDWDLVHQWAALTHVLAVTEGEQGAQIFIDGHPTSFPAPAVTVVDATGAGDVFAAAFFIHLHQTGDPAIAARFAIDLASDSVTRMGIEGVPKRKD
jgi:sugar/nucleoside kinase (ribokinase family)